MTMARKPPHHVLMGDIVKSGRATAPAAMMRGFSKLIDDCNRRFAKSILSPLTITLGDEFQGIIASRQAALEVIFWLEKSRLRAQPLFDLRYALATGEIQTPLNRETAHGMLGPALTNARAALTDKTARRPKFALDVSDAPDTDRDLAPALTGIFTALEGFTARWRPRDYPLISDILAETPVEILAKTHDRDTSSVYRKRITLMTAEYLALRHAALTLGGYLDAYPVGRDS